MGGYVVKDKIKLLGATVVFLSGCVTSYQHFSDPRRENDGYDFICGGVEREHENLRIRGDVCQNIAPNGGEFLHLSVDYLWSK